MSQTAFQSQVKKDPAEDAPKIHHFDRDEYHRMYHAGAMEGKAVELIEGRIVDRGHVAAPTEHRFTRSEYHLLGEEGLFDGKRVELIGGRIYEMSPIGSQHAACVSKLLWVLVRVFGEQFSLRPQSPLGIGDTNEPEPDFVVLHGPADTYRGEHPSTALLAIEVSDSSLAFDRTQKASLYARAGIPDYWIINLIDRQLEVHRDPQPDAAAPFGFSYRSGQILKPGKAVSPLAAPHAQVRVEELLP